jgi:hypothetical protein
MNVGLDAVGHCVGRAYSLTVPYCFFCRAGESGHFSSSFAHGYGRVNQACGVVLATAVHMPAPLSESL